MKTSKKMRGFMCQSTAATALCNVADPRSVIVPRNRPQLQRFINNTTDTTTTTTTTSVVAANNKYSKLVASHNLRLSKPPSVHGHKKSVREYPINNVKGPPSIPSVSNQVFQVVVMRVSIHCQGCAGKVKKHLSKMEGVTSFSIDQETQKVTVMGHITPMGVLESLSKVKRAELWPSIEEEQSKLAISV